MPQTQKLIRLAVSVFLILVIGTVGYHIIEGWPFLDGLYMTVITITTIGFGEVHPLSQEGRIFTLLLIASGLGIVGHTIVAASRWLIEGEVEKVITRRRSMKAIEKIKNHYVVCGYGRMGSFVCHQFRMRGIPFVVVENNPEVQDKITQAGFFLSPGNATEEDVLLAAKIKTAKGLVSVLDSDASNVYVVLTARELNPQLEIIARAGEEDAEKKLLRAGANRVISPYHIGGMRMVMSILKPHVMSFLEVAMDYSQLNVELEEVKVAADSVYCGKQLMETDIRKDLNLIIIAIKKSDGQMVFNPGPHTRIECHDVLIAMGEKRSLELLDRKAGNIHD
ncbi:MAG: potassium channel family protein [Desulfomonilaceae bacterium]